MASAFENVFDVAKMGVNFAVDHHIRVLECLPFTTLPLRPYYNGCYIKNVLSLALLGGRNFRK